MGARAKAINHSFPIWDSHSEVELPFQVVLALLHDDQVLGPAYFSHQRCEFCIFTVALVEIPHSPEIGRGKAMNTWILFLEVQCKLFHHAPAPSKFFLFFSYPFADIPIKADKLLIDCLQRRILCLSYSALNLGYKFTVALLSCKRTHFNHIAQMQAVSLLKNLHRVGFQWCCCTTVLPNSPGNLPCRWNFVPQMF